MSQPDPRQHDEKTAALCIERQKLGRKRVSHWDTIHSMAGDRKRGYGPKASWGMTGAQAIEQLSLAVSQGDARDLSYGLTPSQALARLEELNTELAQLTLTIEEMEKTWREYGWSRFILCLSSNGHIHNYLGCHTLRFDTEVEWHPEFSGLTEAEAVYGTDEHRGLGEILCTHCFPSAPVSMKRDPAEVRRERTAAERAAEQERKAAMKAPKELTGEQRFRDAHGSRVTNVFGCLKAIRDEIQARYWLPNLYAGGTYQAAAARAIEVLLEREADHPGYGKTRAEIDEIVARTERKHEKARAERAAGR